MSKPLLYQRDTDFVRDNLIFNYCLGNEDQLLIESYVHNNHLDIRFDPLHFYFLITGLHKKFTVRYTPDTFKTGISGTLLIYERYDELMRAHGYAGNAFLIKEDNSKQLGVIFSPTREDAASPQEMAQALHDAYLRSGAGKTHGDVLHFISTSFAGPYSGYEQIHEAFMQARKLNDLLFFGVQGIVITEEYRRQTARPCDVTAVLGNVRALLNALCCGTLAKALHQADYLIDELITPSYSMTNFVAMFTVFEDQLCMLETVYPQQVCLQHKPRSAFHTLAQYKEYVHHSLETVFRQLSGVRRYSPTILMALSFINRSYTRDLSLTQISEYVYTNPSSLSSEFNTEVGMSLSEYIAGLRIRRAQTLLRETDASIADIAQQTGFASAKYFREIFKKQTGLSPQTYRETCP